MVSVNDCSTTHLSGVLTDLSAAWFALVFVAPVAGAPAGDALKRVGLGVLFLLLAAKFEEVNE